MSRIKSIFSSLKERNRKALIAYIVCGDPNNSSTLEAMEYMAKNGVDIIEIGVPFSDPMAEGPSIQRAHERSLKNNTSLENILALIGDFRKTNKTVGIVLMGYMNNFESMGAKEFSLKASEKGVDGIIVVDMPPEESRNFTRAASSNNIDLIRLIAPTTEEQRIKNICTDASGYIYYISVKGVTGANKFDPAEVKSKVDTIQSMTDLPVVVGFGIKDADSVTSVRDLSDGIVVGSALVSLIAEGKNQLADKISNKIEELSSALLRD